MRYLILLSAIVAVGCGGPVPRDLEELLVQDSTYFEPETMTPYSGPVFKTFADDSDRVQLEAVLQDGTWNGELTIYHATGRIHYQGNMANGAQCGGWVENDAPTPPASLYEELKEDLESLVIYPECPER